MVHCNHQKANIQAICLGDVFNSFWRRGVDLDTYDEEKTVNDSNTFFLMSVLPLSKLLFFEKKIQFYQWNVRFHGISFNDS